MKGQKLKQFGHVKWMRNNKARAIMATKREKTLRETKKTLNLRNKTKPGEIGSC